MESAVLLRMTGKSSEMRPRKERRKRALIAEQRENREEKQRRSEPDEGGDEERLTNNRMFAVVIRITQPNPPQRISIHPANNTRFTDTDIGVKRRGHREAEGAGGDVAVLFDGHLLCTLK